MLRMEKLCYAIGFTKDMVNSLLTKKEAIRCNGKVYSEEHRRRFEIKNDVFKVEKSSVDDYKPTTNQRMVQRAMGEIKARFTTINGRIKKK